MNRAPFPDKQALSREIIREITDNWDLLLNVRYWKPKRTKKVEHFCVLKNDRLTVGWLVTLLKFGRTKGITQEEWLLSNGELNVWHLHLLKKVGPITIAKLTKELAKTCPHLAIWLIVETKVLTIEVYKRSWWKKYEKELGL